MMSSGSGDRLLNLVRVRIEVSELWVGDGGRMAECGVGARGVEAADE